MIDAMRLVKAYMTDKEEFDRIDREMEKQATGEEIDVHNAFSMSKNWCRKRHIKRPIPTTSYEQECHDRKKLYAYHLFLSARWCETHDPSLAEKMALLDMLAFNLL